MEDQKILDQAKDTLKAASARVAAWISGISPKEYVEYTNARNIELVHQIQSMEQDRQIPTAQNVIAAMIGVYNKYAAATGKAPVNSFEELIEVSDDDLIGMTVNRASVAWKSRPSSEEYLAMRTEKYKTAFEDVDTRKEYCDTWRHFAKYILELSREKKEETQ